MYKLAINRPIATLMFFVALIIFGLISAFSMPINLYPRVNIPLIKITAATSGDLSFIESKITKEIENAISDIDGIKNISSASYDNFSISVVEFELSKDLEIAANDVRDKIGALSLSVKPKIEKISSDAGSIISLFISSKSKDSLHLMRSVDEKLKPFLQRILGIGKIETIGFLKPQIRIKLDPEKLSKYHLNAFDIAQIIQSQNFKQALGELENEKENFIIKGYFEATSLKELGQIRLMPGVFLNDVANIEQGYEDAKQEAFFEGQNGVLLEINKISGYNALEAIRNVKAKLGEFERLAGADLSVKVVYDKSENISKHLMQVIFDLILGVILTMVIVFLFLRNLSATIIASIAIPCSIIATFFLIDKLGFDLNRLTFIALTLSIGIFVDDAIVVIEHISKKITTLSPLQAAFEGISEIGFSVLSISVVLLCVFIPISFMDSVPGLFFNALGISVACGVVVSFLVAVFLIPSLCARFLNPAQSKFYQKSEKFFENIEQSYQSLLSKILKNKGKFILSSFAIIAVCFFLASRLGLDFLPEEDDAEFQIQLEHKQSASLEAMQNIAQEILRMVKSDKRVEYAYLLLGYNDAKESKKAKIYVKLKPLGDRDKRQPAIINEYRQKLHNENLKIKVLSLPKFEGAGIDEPVQFVLLGDDINELLRASERAKAVLASNKFISDIDDNANSKKGEVAVSINKELAKKLNVNPEYAAGVLGYSFGQLSVASMSVGDFKDEVVLSFDEKFKQDIKALEKIEIKNNDGLVLSLASIADFVYKEDLGTINRYNKNRSVKITASNGELSLGSVQNLLISNIDEILGQNSNLNYTFSGFIRMLGETIHGFIIVVALALVLIYLVLAALYESLILPFIIMLTMPLAFAGACLGLFITGNSFSLFVLIAIILLFGMVGKNAILLVDVANQKCHEGLKADDALIEAGKQRLRAILMTTLAMIFAMLPLALSRGSGYEGNSPMAIAVIFGLISSTILTLLVVPALFSFAYKLDVRLRRIYERKKV
ncbi:efflux RND transporter permease subunit [Campylobacter sp. MIT 97-5078]|uniref:efflux RND transporter permease subunit n=1 Tax=Campylobacter sp. MIT 97-5078 TaxID=1548153 RepID=UPI00051396AA|nr:efflux RND transporter permease subunit [Campylobacter sp. MIT 97-5078]KGI56236.1 multidrug transporter [Campylobacter sp. MIT 97-5078]TQR27244.1 AcrB/AcrD/AcrF family protein [Campylobacter sp. MIT 97-5078]